MIKVPTSRFLAYSCGALLSIALLSGLFISSTYTDFDSLSKPVDKINMPHSLQEKVLEDLRNRLGLPQPAADNLKIVKIEHAIAATPGWRITIQAQGQHWVYLAGQDDTIRFDTVASIPEKVRSALSKTSRIPVDYLQIRAAELVTSMRQCPPNAGCLTGYEWKWRILLNNQQVYNFDEEGLEWQRWKVKESSDGLPVNIKSAIMLDAVNRTLEIPSNLNVESIKAVTWNPCSESPNSPTWGPRGTCADVNISGWQVKVRSGAILYTYYVPSSYQEGDPIAPDGMQSIPSDILEQVRQDISKRTKVPAQNLYVLTVAPHYFDRCLDAPGEDCQNGVIAGWSILALINGLPAIDNQDYWVYHASLNGEQTHFVRSGLYAYPP